MLLSWESVKEFNSIQYQAHTDHGVYIVKRGMIDKSKFVAFYIASGSQCRELLDYPSTLRGCKGMCHRHNKRLTQ